MNCIPDEDDSKIDEELRSFRKNLRQQKRIEAVNPKKRFKESFKFQKIELGKDDIDKGFEDIFKS